MPAKSPYQVFIIAPELMTDRTLSLSSRVVLGRLGGYTKRGAQICWPTNQALSVECGLSVHSVSDAIKELCQRKIIGIRNTLYHGKKIRYIEIIYRSLAYIPCSNGNSESSSNELSDIELSSNENSSNEQFNNSSNELSNSSSGEFSSIYTVDNTKEVHKDFSAPPQKTTPKPLNINQSPKDIKYPTTLEETLTFFEPAYNDALQDFPELKEIDMRISADKFLNYWRSKGWKDVFNLSLKARWWLIDALEKLKKDKSRRTYNKRYTSPEQRAQKKLDAEAIFDKYYSDKATEVPETDFVVVEDEDDDDKDKNRSNGSSGAPAMLEMEI